MFASHPLVRVRMLDGHSPALSTAISLCPTERVRMSPCRLSPVTEEEVGVKLVSRDWCRLIDALSSYRMIWSSSQYLRGWIR